MTQAPLNQPQVENEIVVLAHGNCLDGLASCHAAWLHFQDTADYHFMNYGDDLPNMVGKHVYMVDWSVKSHVMASIICVAASVTVLDHHESAEKELQQYFDSGEISGVFDMDRSGAGITWSHFFPDDDLPFVYSIIQMRDLWKHKGSDMEKTVDNITSALASRDMSLEAFNSIYLKGSILAAEGKVLVRALNKRKKAALKKWRWATYGDHKIMVINDTNSDVLNGLLLDNKEADYAVGYTDISDKTIYSLRSTDERVNVSEVATSLGGGGHANASGCSTKLGEHFFDEQPI